MSLKRMLFAICVVLLLLGVMLGAGRILRADGVHPGPPAPGVLNADGVHPGPPAPFSTCSQVAV